MNRRMGRREKSVMGRRVKLDKCGTRALANLPMRSSAGKISLRVVTDAFYLDGQGNAA